MKTITIAVKEPGKEWTLCEVEDTLPEYQRIVDGYIESFWMDTDGIIFFCNEEGKFQDLKFNFRFFDDQIFGTVFAVRADSEGEFCSVSEEDLHKLNNMKLGSDK